MNDSTFLTLGRPESSTFAELSALRACVATEGRSAYRARRRRIERRDFAASALNLSHYLALRRRDIRPLQRELMARGLSSLGRAEGRVLANLDAAAIASAVLEGGCAGAFRTPSHRQFFRGEQRLAAATARIFGPRRHARAGHIMVTLATEAADEPNLRLRPRRA